ncbi:TetR family transcriptional regulator [Murinocardiopsis flavida]|uniref:TetR family transcriptional regulator n=1 Tax=Murinocardiopsis flavida TaxID=645275 RepID=A0A2P8DP11_9ACTN|nr:TetR/AcrR family transcriptional regulator [Murinocardiopsis flavida]PSK98929.1 TetR family transcriptional regulator [Murinocardiopsis flavida]
MSRAAAAESGTRNRTRRAILDAAATALYRNRKAPLADIAAAADVGRSTLHRYFPDREELVSAVIADALQRLSSSVEEARVDEGPPREAMRRLIAAMVASGDGLLFLLHDPNIFEGLDANGEPCGADAEDPDHDLPVLDLIERGQAAGVFDPEVSTAWVLSVLWGLVYTGCEAANEGTLARHAVAATVIRTFENGVAVT